MDQDTLKRLSQDPDGLLTYEYIANHIGDCDDDMDTLVDNMITVNTTGQFIVSAARYLAIIDREKYSTCIGRLAAAAIDRDREHRYIADLLPALWGSDYASRADELAAADNNFRRIYKRLYPQGKI